ncbi:MAG: cupin domain-containing protein [Pseudomonadota bacterium]
MDDTEGKVMVMAESLSALGAEMRALRKVRQLTLKALSDSTGLSLSHLSAVERGTSQPSMDALHTIAQALGVSPDWFFARRPGEGPLERAFVVRAPNRRNLNNLYGQEAGELGYTDELLSSSIGGRFYMGIAHFAPHSDGPERPLLSHEGEEHGLVVEGEIEMQMGEETVTLRTGDSYAFAGSIPHHTHNRTDRPAKLIWAVSPVVIPKDIVHDVARPTKTRSGGR